MLFAARAHSLDDVVSLAQAGFELAEIDWLEPDRARGCARVQEMWPSPPPYPTMHL